MRSSLFAVASVVLAACSAAPPEGQTCAHGGDGGVSGASTFALGACACWSDRRQTRIVTCDRLEYDAEGADAGFAFLDVDGGPPAARVKVGGFGGLSVTRSCCNADETACGYEGRLEATLIQTLPDGGRGDTWAVWADCQ